MRALRAIAVKLQHTDENSPEYWPTVLRFIHIASAAGSPKAPPPGSPINIRLTNVGLENQALPPRLGVVLFDGGSATNFRFEDSRIIFTEHPVQLRNVTFINCAFEMPDMSAPTPYIKNAARELLASNLTAIPSL
jgi:hypothetical protein